jgi:hypothetical protein
MLYKLNADILLSEITKENLEYDFLFFDRRSSKLNQFHTKNSSYYDPSMPEPTLKSFSTTMIGNPNFLIIDRVMKKDRLSTTYEPTSFSIEVGNTKISYYVSDPLIPTDGIWVEVTKLCDGRVHTIERTEESDANGCWNDTSLVMRLLSGSDTIPVPTITVAGSVTNLRRIKSITRTPAPGTQTTIFNDPILI